MKKLLAAVVPCFAIVSFAFGQSDLQPVGQYPEFRTQSGLPGSGFGILPNGAPSFAGAMTFSTPIGYSLNDWHISMAVANTSSSSLLRWIHTARDETSTSIGKAYFMVGVPLGKFGSITASYWIISSFLDQALNFQYQFPIHYHNVGLSLGVQDYYGHVGTGASTFFPQSQYKSQSWYGVVTVPMKDGIYLTGGWGNKRWAKGFASASVPIQKRLKFMVEHDGFNFNVGMAWDPQLFSHIKVAGRDLQSTVMVGLVRGKYAFWSVNLSF